MKRTVVHISTGLELGGAEQILVNCVLAGRDSGYDSVVIALKSGGPTRETLLRHGVEVIELGMSARWPDPWAVLTLSRVMRRKQPDIVMSWMYHANIIASAAVAMVPGLSRQRLFWGIYNSALDLSQYGWILRTVIKTNQLFSSHPRAVVYNSKKAHLDHEAMGYIHRKTVIVNNGIDLKRFVPSPDCRVATRKRWDIHPDAKVALIVARFDPQKDWASVLAGVSKVEGLTTVAIGPTTHLLPEQPGLMRLGKEMAMEQIYPAADVFLLPSAFGEGTSVAMSEAMACGVPPVVTDVGDNALFARDCGRIVPVRDPDALARALQDLFADPAERQALGIRARGVAERQFGPDASFTALFEQWNAVAAES